MAKRKNFEQSLESLEQIVRELESGDLSLEESLKKFETGMQLSKQCTQQLDLMEKKIDILVRGTDGTNTEKPLDDPGGS